MSVNANGEELLISCWSILKNYKWSILKILKNLNIEPWSSQSCMPLLCKRDYDYASGRTISFKLFTCPSMKEYWIILTWHRALKCDISNQANEYLKPSEILDIRILDRREEINLQGCSLIQREAFETDVCLLFFPERDLSTCFGWRVTGKACHKKADTSFQFSFFVPFDP